MNTPSRPMPRFEAPARDRSVTVTRSSYDFPRNPSPAPARSAPHVSFDGLPMPSWARDAEPQTVAPAAAPLGAFDGVFGEEAPAASEDVPWLSLGYLGTFGACYQFYEWGERLLVVDQHAFHERILYEKLTRDQKLLEASQPLLMPEVIELGPMHVARFGEAQATLKRLGFDVVPVSTSEVEVRAVPALLIGKEVQGVLETIGVWLDGTDEIGTDVIHHEVLSTIACHSAVRAGETMTDEDREILLRQAGEVDFFHNCPHGRRVLRIFEKRAVADWFDR